jgi:hypothetical protein
MATPEELWQRLVDETGEEAIESAAAVSVAQAERDLVAAGFDVSAERARADARVAALTGGAPLVSPAPEPAAEPTAWVRVAAPAARRSPVSRRAAVWLAAALLAAATAGGVFYAAAHRPKPPDKPVEAPSATATASPPQGVTPSIAPTEPLPGDDKSPRDPTRGPRRPK